VVTALAVAAVLSQLVPPTASCPGVPAYPTSEKASGVSGDEVLAVTISVTGEVKDIAVKTSLGAAFDAAAVEAARACAFTAATMDGKSVPAIVELKTTFVPPLLPWTLEGEVVGELGEGLGGATVSFGEQAARTDSRGHFSLTFESIPPGDSWVRVHLEGRADKAFPEVFKSGQTTRVRYLLPKQKVFESRVEGSRLLPAIPDTDKTPQVSHFTITRADIDRTPGALEDVARVAQTMPGVAADPDLLATLFIRGGGPEEVVFYLDGVPLQNPYHLGGFASIFNPMMMESAELYTGAVPARYEPSLSGAFEVHYATGETKKPRVLADVSLLSAQLRADIPTPVEGLSVVVSARRSFAEAYFSVLKSLNVVGQNYVAPELTELLARVNFRRGRHQTTATYLFGSDGLDFILKPGEQPLFAFSGGVKISNTLHLALLQHRIDFSGDSRLTLSAAYTHDGNLVDVSGDTHYANDARHDDFLVRVDGVAATSDRARSQLGAQFAHRSLGILGEVTDARADAPWAQTPFVQTTPTTFAVQSVVTDLFALYAEQLYRPVDPLTLEAGGRVQLDARTTKWSGSGRVAAAWALPFTAVLKLSAGVSLQPVQAPLLLDPTFGNPNLLPERSWQVIAGIEQPLPFEALLKLEVWGKYLDHLVANPDTPAALARVEAAGAPVFQNVGTGFARGADLLLLGRTRHFYYGVSMGLLFSDRTNPLAQDVTTYPTPWDQRFTAGLNVTWSPNDHWLVTGRFNFRTGRPYTPVLSFVLDPSGHYEPLFGAPDSARYPAFYELSARAEYRFNVWQLKMAAYLECLNITNAQNVFAYVYGPGDPASMTPPSQGAINHLPIRPFIGIRAEY
jgi:TonB family protein